VCASAIGPSRQRAVIPLHTVNVAVGECGEHLLPPFGFCRMHSAVLGKDPADGGHDNAASRLTFWVAMAIEICTMGKPGVSGPIGILILCCSVRRSTAMAA
jgi:hypothetical protein